MIDVTNSNFLELLPEIRKAISECDFVAIDTELSGLMRGRTLHHLDLPCERFSKVVESSHGYLILQFGLACFKSKLSRTNHIELDHVETNENKLSFKSIIPSQDATSGDLLHIDRFSGIEVSQIEDVEMFQEDNRSNVSLDNGDNGKKVPREDLEEGEIADCSSDEENRPARKESRKKGLPKNLAYSCIIYNFYIFPQPMTCFPDVDTNRTFSMQTSAINFLCTHGFDFNKLFRDGISYLNRGEEKMIKDRVEKEQIKLENVVLDKNGIPNFVPIDMRQYVKNALQQVKEYLNADPNRIVLKCLELESCSLSRRTMIIKSLKVQPYFDQMDLQVIHDRERNQRYISISRVDQQLKMDKRQQELDQARGFLQILYFIVGNQKPLVGHNLLLDLLHMIDQFFEPVSDDYLSFKELCHQLFPTIYDTKYIASTHGKNDISSNQTPLGDLYQILKQEPYPTIEIEIDSLESMDTQLHKAGYDAYLSGYCFIALCDSYINSNTSSDATTSIDHLDLTSQECIREAFCNKIFFSLSYDLKYFDLEKDDILPDRGHVYHVEFQTEDWLMEDLFKIFQPWGGVNVFRKDKLSIHCALRDPRMSKKININKIKPTIKCQIKHLYSTHSQEEKNSIEEVEKLS